MNSHTIRECAPDCRDCADDSKLAGRYFEWLDDNGMEDSPEQWRAYVAGFFPEPRD